MEPAGIEPASDEVLPGLLRAQSAVGVARSWPSRRRAANPDPAGLMSASRPPARVTPSGYLADATIRGDSDLGVTDSITDQAARAKSVRLDSALIGLQRAFDEMTLHPRPASPDATHTVETDRPQGGDSSMRLSITTAGGGREARRS